MLEQQYQLKRYGKLTLFEQDQMTAEDRAWWIQRIDRDHKEQAEREKKATSRIPRR